MKYPTFIPVFLCAAFLSLAAVSEAGQTDLLASAAEIQGFGVFETSSSKRYKVAGNRHGAVDAVTGVRFVDFTKEIPAVLGTNFGFKYAVNTTPRGQNMRVKSVIRFPAPGLKAPGGKVYTESVEYKDIKIGKPDLHGFGFDEPWEIVPGDWVFEVWYRDTRMIRKTFTVTSPDTVIANE